MCCWLCYWFVLRSAHIDAKHQKDIKMYITNKNSVDGVVSDAGKILGAMALLGSVFEEEARRKSELTEKLQKRYHVVKGILDPKDIFPQEKLEKYLEYAHPDWENFCIGICIQIENVRKIISDVPEFEEGQEVDNGFINYIAYNRFLHFAEVCSGDACEAGVQMCLNFAKDFILREAPKGFGQKGGLPQEHPFLDWWEEFSHKRDNILRTLDKEVDKAVRVRSNSFGNLLSEALEAKSAVKV